MIFSKEIKYVEKRVKCKTMGNKREKQVVKLFKIIYTKH